MIKTSMLILDKRLELGTKYKKTCEKFISKVFLESQLETAFDVLLHYEPDLILISDSFANDFSDITQKIKIFTQNYRPTIVYISKSDLIDDKLKALENGADDYLSEPISTEELQARIKAHFRRIIETNVSETTNFYGNKLSMVVLKRSISESKPHSILLITLDNFEPYKEIYGSIAADKVMQTYAAIINSSLTDNDFLGQLSSSEFLVITSIEKAEKIAAYLVFAFDTVAEKFYSEKDAKNHFILRKNDNSTEEKIGLVKTKIAIVKNEQKKYTNIKTLLNDLLATLKLTKNQKKSSYAVDRIKFPTNECIENTNYNDTIAIIEPDASLCFLLATTAQMQGYKASQHDYSDEIIEKFHQKQPAVVILDMGDTEQKEGLDLCRKIKSDRCLSTTKIILTSNLHNKEEIMNCGADIYLPKPYDLITIYSWIAKLIKDFNY